MNGQAQQLSAAMLLVGCAAMGATHYLGSPWPGMVLCGLSLVPWGVGAWLARGQSSERRTIDAMAETLNKHSNMHMDVADRLNEHDQQINSLRNAASLRGTLGG